MYRWIVYVETSMPGSFTLFRATSIEDAAGGFRSYEYRMHSECWGRLYPFSAEDWGLAEEFRGIGCPFDYPCKVIERGPRGGLRVTNA